VISPYGISIWETFILACFAYVCSQYVCKSLFRTHKMTATLLQERVRVLSRRVFVGCWSLEAPTAVSCLKSSFTTKLVNGENRHRHFTPGPPYVVEVFTGYTVPTASKFTGKIGLFLSSRVGVGIATRYGLDGPGIESRWGRDFLHPSRPALGPTQPSIQWVAGISRG
jgi:hypothetical protein